MRLTRRSNVNDPHRLVPARPETSIAVIKAQKFPTQRELDRRQKDIWNENRAASLAWWIREKGIVKLQRAMQLVLASSDKRRRPSEVDQETFGLLRFLRLTRTAKLKLKYDARGESRG